MSGETKETNLTQKVSSNNFINQINSPKISILNIIKDGLEP